MRVQRPLNVLISSTRQWNPGDEFILMGVRRLLESILGDKLRYVLWNRNPDLFIDRWEKPYLRPTFLTNSASGPTLDIMDLVVIAGSPEWAGPPLERVYRELIRYPKVPLLAIGIGSGGPGFAFSTLETEIYQRENTLVVCRNPTLCDEINTQLGMRKAHLLPCPALFASPNTTPRSEESFARGKMTLGVQGDSVDNQAGPSKLAEIFKSFVLNDRDTHAFDYVAHYIDEFVRFSRFAADRDVFYSYEPFDYLNYFGSSVRALITSRLHGGIAGLSCGTPAFVVEFGSSRVNDTLVPYEGLLPCLSFEECLRQCRELTPAECSRRSEGILAFKNQTFSRYRRILSEFLSRHLAKWSGEAYGAATDGSLHSLSSVA